MPKLQVTTTGTYMISLPKEAVKALRWKEGTQMKAIATKRGILLTRY